MITPDGLSVNLINLLLYPEQDSILSVFEDEHFQRQRIVSKFQQDIEISVINDDIDDSGMKCCFISLQMPEGQGCQFVIENAQVVSGSSGRLIDCDNQLMLWIPKEPVSRDYDAQGRIVNKSQMTFETESCQEKLSLSVTGAGPKRVEFGVVVFAKQTDQFKTELLSLRPIEKRKTIKSSWFAYEDPSDVWDYMINGNFFNSKYRPQRKGFESQNMAFTLYHYLDFLFGDTRKEIYRLLREVIAYSVMLSLTKEDCWRHGVWTDLKEVHTIHQVVGIHVFLTHYEKTGRSVFLQKAKDAMDYLIAMADKLSDNGLWFLHDELELNDKDVRLFYKDIVLSNAFGKSLSNTLCINTHLATLIALQRLDRIDPSDKYRDYYCRGYDSLKKVMLAQPCGLLYSILYRLSDFLGKLDKERTNVVVKKINKVYGLVLRGHILPVLKKWFPRIVMPNGFLERDLSYSVLSENYHILNIKEMLMLYCHERDKWLETIITKSINYTIDSGYVRSFAEKDLRASKFLEVILMYAAFIDEEYFKYLAEYIHFFKNCGIAMSTDVLSNPLIVDTSIAICVDNEDVMIFTPVEGKSTVAIALNQTDKDLKVTISSPDEAMLKELEAVDTDGNRFTDFQQLKITSRSFLKITRKAGLGVDGG
jgi:hypothetical protein